MANMLNPLQIVTLVLISLGAGVMAFATWRMAQILSLKLAPYRRRLQVLLVLVLFFLISYLAVLALILTGHSDWLLLGVGLIFFFGALFVYLVTQVSALMIADYLSAQQGLQDRNFQLDDRVSELQRRIDQLNSVAEISQIISGVRELQQLFPQVADLMRERFDLYYVGVFLVDESRRYAVLQAGTGEAGAAMLAARYRLSLSETSMVGWAILNRRPRIALDVGEDAVRFSNPHLPNTRSELALPLIAGERAIGALTIQSDKPAAFDQNDITILQNIANILTIAIENARLMAELQANLDEIHTLHGQYILEGWSKGMPAGEMTEYTVGAEVSSDAPVLDVPLTLRDQVIGQITLEGESEWTEEERSLIEAVATQAALALENARLLEESQQMALHERLSAEIIRKVWASQNVETILQTAVRELGRALRADDASIHLEIETTPATSTRQTQEEVT